MIERLIYEQIKTDNQIKGLLAVYKQEPAFFYQKSPIDSDKGWLMPCYPRVDYNIDMMYDPERKMAGTLSINIWCTDDCPPVGDDDPDKAIEKRLIELIGGTFYTGSDRATVCAIWNRSDAFDYERNTSMRKEGTTPEIFGITILFDLLEFPEQITTTPDPILGANSWIKQQFPQMVAIAHDDTPPIYKPTDENPAIYWRFIGADTGNKQTYAVTWYTGHFAAHVIAETVTERNKWTKAIIEQLQLWQEIILADSSPMFINRITVRNHADPLRDGQIELTGTYGVLDQHRKEEAGIRLMKRYFN